MYLGRVIGTVVAHQIVTGLVGSKLLLVQPVDDELAPNGAIHAAVDTAKAGLDDLVYLVGSREAALALEPFFVPVDAAIIGIVDQLYTPERGNTEVTEVPWARRGQAPGSDPGSDAGVGDGGEGV